MEPDTATTTAALEHVAALGGYFAVTVRDTAPTDGDWRPVTALYEPAEGALDAVVARTAAQLGTTDLRVGASILQQGYAARLWSPVLGSTATAGLVPRLAIDSVYWRSTNHSVLELLVAAPTAHRAGPDPERTARLVERAVLDEHVRPLADAVRARTGVSAKILAGNTTSALFGTVRVLAGHRLDAAVETVADALLDTPGLRGTGTVDRTGTPPALRRASCCLYYRVPGGGLCGDCVLHGPAR